MIKSITGLAIRFFQSNKFVVNSSVLSVLLSISLIITLAVFASNAKESIVQQMQQMYGEMDIAAGYDPEQEKLIDQSLLEEMTDHESIQQYSPLLITHVTVDEINYDVYTIGVQNDELAKSRYHFTHNIKGDEVLLNQSLADALNVTVGDVVSIHSHDYTVMELLDDHQASGTIVDRLILPSDTVEQLHQQGELSYLLTFVLMKAYDDGDVYAIAEHIRQIDSEMRIDIAQEEEYLQENISSLTVFISALSVLILIIASLFIISNFDVLLYKYKFQFAIMRSFGASTTKLFQMVFTQSLLINTTGTALGYLLAWMSYRMLQPGLERIFSFEIQAMSFHHSMAVVVAAMGMFVIQAFLLIPAYKSSKILPVKLLSDNESNDFSNETRLMKSGVGVLGGAVLCVIVGVMYTIEILILLAALLLVLGSFILFPIYLPRLLRWMLPKVEYALGRISFVAVNNMIPQSKNHAFVMLSIATMMMIVVFGSALLNTTEKSGEEHIHDQFVTNILVTNRVHGEHGLDPSEIKSTIQEMESVDAVSTKSTNFSSDIKKEGEYVNFDISLVDLTAMQHQRFISSDTDVGPDSVVISEHFAEQHGLSSGDELELYLFSFEEQQLLPAGQVTVSEILPSLPGSSNDGYIDWGTPLFQEEEYISFERAFVTSTNESKTMQELEELKGQYPEIQVSSLQETLELAREMFYQRWILFIVVTIVILISVMLGVWNTLFSNIQHKRKEFAVLRTLGLGQHGIVRVILTQVLLYLVVGILLGLVCGVVFTYVLSLIDGSPVYFNYLLVSIVIIILVGMAVLSFIFFAKKIAQSRLAGELSREKK